MKTLLFLLVIHAAVIAYPQNPSVITVKAGEESDVLYKHVYRYPRFLPGKVYFINDSARAPFNYNLLDSKIEFIGDKMDTLVFSDEKLIRQIIIEKDSFFFYNGSYLRSIGDYGFARLFIKETLKLLDEKNIGTYGIPSSTHSIESRSTLLSLQTRTLQLNKDLVFSRENEFLFSHNGRYVAMTKKNILKQLNAKEKSLVESFVEEQSTDLKKEEDLQQLFQYIATLKNK